LSSEHTRYFKCPVCGLISSSYSWGVALGTDTTLASSRGSRRYLSYDCPNKDVARHSASGWKIEEVFDHNKIETFEF
jgi:hypothetical protein